MCCSLKLPDLRVAWPDRNWYYFRYPEPMSLADRSFVAKLPQRNWSEDDKQLLKTGLQQVARDADYSRLPRNSKYYSLSHYVMRDRFTPKEIERAMRRIVRGHPDWIALRV